MILKKKKTQRNATQPLTPKQQHLTPTKGQQHLTSKPTQNVKTNNNTCEPPMQYLLLPPAKGTTTNIQQQGTLRSRQGGDRTLRSTSSHSATRHPSEREKQTKTKKIAKRIYILSTRKKTHLMSRFCFCCFYCRFQRRCRRCRWCCCCCCCRGRRSSSRSRCCRSSGARSSSTQTQTRTGAVGTSSSVTWTTSIETCCSPSRRRAHPCCYRRRPRRSRTRRYPLRTRLPCRFPRA